MTRNTPAVITSTRIIVVEFGVARANEKEINDAEHTRGKEQHTKDDGSHRTYTTIRQFERNTR